MRIILTGATSFLGAAAARAFLRRGHEVYAPVRSDSKNLAALPSGPGMHVLKGDLGKSEELAESLKKAFLPGLDGRGLYAFSDEPPVCLHFGWSGVGVNGRMDPEIQAENVRNTLSFIRLLGKLGTRRFLFAGSQAEYGMTLERAAEEGLVTAGKTAGPLSFDESLPCRPVSEYGKGKLRVLKEGQEEAERLGIEYVHLRIFSVYGPGDHGTSLVQTCVKAAADKAPLTLGPCRQLWNYLYIDDFAMAAVLLSEYQRRLPHDIYNIGSRDTRPLREFAEEIFRTAGTFCGGREAGEETAGKETAREDMAGKETVREDTAGGIGITFEERPAGPEGTPFLAPDISRLYRDTGFLPEVPFAGGIRAMLSAMRQA